MQTRSRDIFATIRTEGALLPADILQRIGEGDGDLEGLKPGDYHLVEGEKLNEAISRSWNRLLAVWNSFRAAVDKLPEKDLGTTLTREKWLLPLFQELGYGRLPTSKAVLIEGKSYPISHFWQPAPIHLIGCRVDIDRRTAGVAGAARVSPHGLVQEFLNRSEPHLWAFVSNGLRLRILRDNVSLTRQAFVEFDLAGMMDGEVYSDFILLWLLCHQSRVEVPEDKSPEHCWLEKWTQAAQQRGTRVLDQLRKGVEEAIKSLGSGFLAHLANTELKEKLKTGTLDKQDYYRQLLRTVYRLIFIFVSEDRGLLLDPQAGQQAKDCYMQYYSATRLRKLAQNKRGTRHYDLWRGLSLVFDKLGSNEGCPELALPALGSFLWSKEAIAELDGCDISNRDFLEAVRALAFTIDNNILRAVDYKNLGSEELGSVYESLLELHPELNVDVGAFELTTAAGSERKTTGSYYTPTSLVNCLLDSALEPVLDEAVKKDNPEQAILNLKVCDPATGSGHFLVAAAHRMAKRLAAIRTGDDEPSPQATRMALRDVIGHCVYGVDINPMAVELCRVSLWLEALEPGRPLSFLDHHIKCGNSLLGITPALLEKGIPDDAFKPIEGDDKVLCKEYKKQNKDERKGQAMLFYGTRPWDRLGNLPVSMLSIDEMPDDTVEDVEQKRKKYAEIVNSTSYKFGRLLADAWCSAFIFPKTKEINYPITEKIYREIEENPHSVSLWMEEEISRLKKRHQFFHWHLEFPDVFRIPAEKEAPENEQAGWSGGFDCVLGNPPWEHVELKEKEYFVTSSPEIARAPNASKRKKLIQKLKESNPVLYDSYQKDFRKINGETHFIRNSNYYPLCGRGRINTYAIFAELNRNLISPSGRVGCIVPSGIATDDTTKFFFQSLMDSASLASLYDFENREKLFPAVDSRMKFCLLTMAGIKIPCASGADFVYFALSTSHLAENNCHFSLTAEEIALLNPNTRTCPIFRSKADAELTKYIYRRVPVLINENNPENGNPWGISFKQGLFNMSSDSGLFRTREELEEKGFALNGNIFEGKKVKGEQEKYLPLYEGKMVWQFDSYFGTFDEIPLDLRFRNNAPANYVQDNSKMNPLFVSIPRYWVTNEDRLKTLPTEHYTNSYLCYRFSTCSTNERTMVCTVLSSVCTNHIAPLIFIKDYIANKLLFLQGVLNSFGYDFVLRQKMGRQGLDIFFLKQTIIPPYEVFVDRIDIFKKILELTYTAWDLEAFAKDCGYDGPPFVWDEERRFKIRAELDAAYFHLYLGTEQQWKEEGSKELLRYFPTPRAVVDYIMETFPIVKRKDEAKYGSYRTKELILEIYDKMAEAIRTGQPYQTILDPPPGPPADENGNFIPISQWDTANWPSHIHPPRRI